MNGSGYAGSQQPGCYGKSWDSKDTDCSGGFNPAYKGTDGTRIQPKCDFFEACRSSTSAQRIQDQKRQQPAQPERVIPTQSLLRTSSATSYYPQPVAAVAPTPPAPPAMVPPALVPAGLQGVAAQLEALLQQNKLLSTVAQHMNYYPPPGTPPAEYRRESLGPSPTVAPYLAVAERRRAGEGWTRPLGRELARAGLKAIFQTAANFMDFVPLEGRDKE